MTLSIPETIRLLMPNGEVKKMPLEEYVRGVLAAVMPTDAPLEALKAQAVAARTFGAITRRHTERGADVCTLRHCQAWKPTRSAAAARAVQETRGIVAVHNGQLIDAYYFEHCDGCTRDAASVLIQAPIYLRSVDCACGFATLKGHGVGMCQSGSLVMARFGDSFEVILRHYYDGITLEYDGAALSSPGESARTAESPTSPGQPANAEPSPSERPRRSRRDSTRTARKFSRHVPAPSHLMGPSPEEATPSDRAGQAPPPRPILSNPPEVQGAAPAPTEQIEQPPTENTPTVELAQPIDIEMPPASIDTVPDVEIAPTGEAVPMPVAEPAIAELPPAPSDPPVPLSEPGVAPAEATAEPTSSPMRAEMTSETKVTAYQAEPLAKLPERPVARTRARVDLTSGWYPTAEEILPEADASAAAEIDEALEAAEEFAASTPVKPSWTPPESSAVEIDLFEYVDLSLVSPPDAPDSMPEEIVFLDMPIAPFAILPAPDSMPEELIVPCVPPAPPPPPVQVKLTAPVEPLPVPGDKPSKIESLAPSAEEKPGQVQAPPAEVDKPTTIAPPAPSVEEKSPPIEAPALPVQPFPGPVERASAPLDVIEPVSSGQEPPLSIGETTSPARGQVVLDHLPGPRVIAGDLARPDIIVTIRDAVGNAVITVSGTAPHYGVGGFEAPLAEDGTCTVSFDHHAIEIEMQDETVFVCYSE